MEFCIDVTTGVSACCEFGSLAEECDQSMNSNLTCSPHRYYMAESVKYEFCAYTSGDAGYLGCDLGQLAVNN